jgi:hypothetical protein
MNTDQTAADYFKRCFIDLGQQAHDPQRVAIWCYNNPPKRPIPELNKGERAATIFISRRVFHCLRAIGLAIDREYPPKADALADALLTQAVKDQAPGIWNMYERHEQEIEDRIAELRHNEPTLAQKEAS